jgi:hypothetical protein
MITLSDEYLAKRASSMRVGPALGEDVSGERIAGGCPPEVMAMRSNSQLSAGYRTSTDGHVAQDASHSWLDVIIYPLLVSVFAVIAGAAVSLAVKGVTRVIVWSAISAAVSVALGLAHGSAQDRSCRAACERLWSWLASS